VPSGIAPDDGGALFRLVRVSIDRYDDRNCRGNSVAAEMTAPLPLRRTRVSGIDRAIQVLDFLTERGAPATAYDVARGIGAPTSTIYETIDTLAERGLLSRDADGGVFLGPKLHFYGLAYARDLDLNEVLRTRIRALSVLSGETVQVCGRDGDRMVVLMMEAGPGHFRISSRVGSRVPLNWTASGRLLLAPLPAAERRVLIACAEASPTGRAETDPDRIEAACRAAWAARLSVQIGEADEAVACIAAPVRDREGGCPVTVSIVAGETRARERHADLADQVRRAAADIEAAMGWRHPDFDNDDKGGGR
jgi:DNA-binding IclR family transcriptional regulator